MKRTVPLDRPAVLNARPSNPPNPPGSARRRHYEAMRTRTGLKHWVGDDCLPDGHGTEFIENGYKPLWTLAEVMA